MRFLFLIFTLAGQVTLAQTFDIHDCGIDANAKLNKDEAAYFNEIFKRQRKSFDFNDKKIGFAHGDVGKDIITKKAYFDRWAREYYNKKKRMPNQLLICTLDQKMKSGGYDALIVCFSNESIGDRQRMRILKRLE